MAAWDNDPPVKASDSPWENDAPVAQPEQRSTAGAIGRQVGLTARAGISGLASIPAMIGDAMGLKSSEAVQKTLSQVGLPEPENATERVAQDVAGAMTGTGALTKIGGMMAQGAGPVASRVGTMLATQPAAQTMASGTGAGSASLAREEGAGPVGQIAAGIAGALAPSMAARIISPKVAPQVTDLAKEGITPTLGQTLGGAPKRIEEGLTSVWGLGDLVRSGQRRTVDEFNRAAYNRALAPIGQTVAKDSPVGRQGLVAVENALSSAYDDLLPQLKVQADKQFIGDLQNLTRMTQGLGKDRAQQFATIIQQEVGSKFTPSGLMSGETMKQVESELARRARGYSGSSTFDERQLGNAIEEARQVLKQMVERSNPQHVGELSKINEGWANFVRLRQAGTALGAKDGVFSPAQLENAVKAKDASMAKSKFMRGDALMQDLAEKGMKVMGPTVPDSGTPFRMGTLGTLLAGGQLVEPTTATLGAVMAAPYTRVGQNAAYRAIAQRPESMRTLADLMRLNGGSPALLPAGAGIVP